MSGHADVEVLESHSPAFQLGPGPAACVTCLVGPDGPRRIAKERLKSPDKPCASLRPLHSRHIVLDLGDDRLRQQCLRSRLRQQATTGRGFARHRERQRIGVNLMSSRFRSFRQTCALLRRSAIARCGNRTPSKRIVGRLAVNDKDAAFRDRALPGFGLGVCLSGAGGPRRADSSRRTLQARDGVTTWRCLTRPGRKEAARIIARIGFGEESIPVAPEAGPCTEYAVGHFSRSFSLASALDQSGISASVDKGLLLLNLPKAHEAAARAPEPWRPDFTTTTGLMRAAARAADMHLRACVTVSMQIQHDPLLREHHRPPPPGEVQGRSPVGLRRGHPPHRRVDQFLRPRGPAPFRDDGGLAAERVGRHRPLARCARSRSSRARVSGCR